MLVVRWWLLLGLAVLSLAPGGATAQTFQSPGSFISQSLGGGASGRVLKLSGAQQAQARRIMGHGIGGSVRYWRGGGSTVWILNGIGKYKPITTGWLVSGGRIRRARVLVYREAPHGLEVRFPQFTSQFSGAGRSGTRLNRGISNISGATLSVNSMKRMAALALYLDSIAK